MLTNKLRMYIIYFLILVAVVAGCIGVAAKFEQKEMQLAMTKQENVVAKQGREIEALEEKNREQVIAIAKIEAARLADSTVLDGLGLDMRKLGLAQTSAMRKIDYLEKSNAQVRQFLDSPVPPDGCVLDASCEAPGVSGPAGGGVETKQGSAAAVRAADAGKGGNKP